MVILPGKKAERYDSHYRGYAWGFPSRPFTIPSYEEIEWHSGIAHVEKEYPNILFAKYGEIFDLDGLKTVAIGGAYSIDKMMRIAYGWGWWEDEQPSEEIKLYVEQQLTDNNWKVDVVLSLDKLEIMFKSFGEFSDKIC